MKLITRAFALALLVFAAAGAIAQGLSSQQLVALRAAALADPGAAACYQPPGDAACLRVYLNGTGSTQVWRTDAEVNRLLDSITWASYTATATIAGTEAEPLLSRKIGWLLEVQVKQMNLQMMLQGRQTLSCAPPALRAGLRDAVIQVPTGALDGNGKPALLSPGGASGGTLMGQCARPGRRAEVMLAAAAQGSDTTGGVTARVMTWEGEVSEVDSVRLMYRDDGSIWTP